MIKEIVLIYKFWLEKSKSLSFSPQNVEPLLRNREHCADSEECSKPVKIIIHVV